MTGLTGLNKLIAMQKAKPNDTQESGSNSGNATPANQADPVPADAPQPESVPPVNSPAPQAPAKPAGLGLNNLGLAKLRAGGTSSGAGANNSAGTPKPPASPAAPAVVESGILDGPVFGLADLAGFDSSDTPEVRAREERQPSGFDDEIEATAPERIFSPEMTPQMLSFIESLDSIYPVLHDPDLFGQAVRIIMLELQEHPEYKKLVGDQDVHTMIRGMRNTMGLARIRKQEKSRKATGTGKPGRIKKAGVSDDDMALLESLMGGDAGD